MDNLSAIAASGMRARMQELDILANNLANSSSSGYKSDREIYSLYSAKDACMTPDQFKAFYPQWERFARYKDPALTSGFWERVTGQEMPR